MSEIKGQLLGLLLVMTIFGTVGATITGVFQKTQDTIVNRVNAQTLV